MTGSEYRRNPAQEEAVAHTAGPLRILAGAGSGKTTTLVRRIDALLKAGLCHPAELLMLTFTNKAVADMRRQVAEKLPAGSEQPRIETYHAFALALVREFAPDLGLPPEPALLTAGPIRLFVRRHFDRLGIGALDLRRLDAAISTALEFFSWHRHEGTYLQDEAELLALLDPTQHDLALITELLAAHRAYRELLREHGAADYDDLIALAVQLLEVDPAVRQEIQSRYRYMLVDEYQDTDHLQGRMIQLLAGDGQNITVVGDPDQTIYSFRGAAASNILDFPRLFPGTREIAMVTNYRSTPAIIAAANAVIAHNTRSKEIPLVADRPQADLPRPLLVEAPGWPAEARWIAGEIRRLHDRAGAAWGDMAILVRLTRHKLPLYAALVEAGVPARVIGGMDLFADAETARFIAYLRALAVPDADGDLSVALGLPRYGLTDADIARLSTVRQPGERLIDAVARLSADPSDAAGPALNAFLAEFWPLYRLQHTEGYEAAIRGALALHAGAMGLQARLNADQLLPLARGFFAQVRLLADEGSASPMALFCQYLQALREDGEAPEGVAMTESEDAVTVMTVHAAKGLQFPVVFLPRLTASDFHPKSEKWSRPFPLAWHHDPEFSGDVERMTAEEERRIFYVALTRAMDRLYLSWAPVDPARKKPVLPSQFLTELGDTCDRPAWDEIAVDLPAVADRPDQPDLLPALQPLLSRDPARPLAPAEPGAFTPRVPAVLSFTHLSTYQTCPYRFYLQYLLHLPGRPAHTADAGIRIHAAIERLARAAGQGAAVTYDEFTAWAAAPPPPDPDGAFDPSDPAGPDTPRPGADEPEGEGGSLSGGRPDEAEALRHFWASEYGQTPPIAAEQEFYLPLGGAVVRGFIDRIHRRPDGSDEVVDFKTYSHMLTESQVRQSLQLPLYIRACREAFQLPVTTGAMYFLKQNQTVRVTYTEDELAVRLREAEALVAAIRKGDWAPTPGAVCRHCPYAELCPVSAAPN